MNILVSQLEQEEPEESDAFSELDDIFDDFLKSRENCGSRPSHGKPFGFLRSVTGVAVLFYKFRTGTLHICADGKFEIPRRESALESQDGKCNIRESGAAGAGSARRLSEGSVVDSDGTHSSESSVEDLDTSVLEVGKPAGIS